MQSYEKIPSTRQGAGELDFICFCSQYLKIFFALDKYSIDVLVFITNGFVSINELLFCYFVL